jgi:hypothetical protein
MRNACKEEDKEKIVKSLNIVLESDKRAEKSKIFNVQLKQQELNRELLQRQRLEKVACYLSRSQF